MFLFCTKVSFLCNEHASGVAGKRWEKSFRYPEIIRLEVIHLEINHTEITRPEMPLYGYRGAVGQMQAGPIV